MGKQNWFIISAAVLGISAITSCSRLNKLAIDVRADGQALSYGIVMSRKELEVVITNRVALVKHLSVVVRVARGTTYDQVLSVLEVCLRSGVDSLSVNMTDKTIEELNPEK